MRIVDVNLVISQPGPMPSEDVAEAWVIDSRQRVGPARPGAVTTAAATPAFGGSLRRQAVLLPDEPVGLLETRMAEAVAAGAPTVARICPGPGGHGFPLLPWAVTPIPELCERAAWALAIDLSDRHPFQWGMLVAFARTYPGLPIVALAAPFDDHTAIRALDATSNLVLETSAVRDPATIVSLAAAIRWCGAHRVVYGTGGLPGAALPAGADIGDADREALMAGTADQLGGGAWASTWL